MLGTATAMGERETMDMLMKNLRLTKIRSVMKVETNMNLATNMDMLMIMKMNIHKTPMILGPPAATR